MEGYGGGFGGVDVGGKRRRSGVKKRVLICYSKGYLNICEGNSRIIMQRGIREMFFHKGMYMSRNLADFKRYWEAFQVATGMFCAA